MKRRNKDEFNWTIHNKVYRALLKIKLSFEENDICPRCPFHGGCYDWDFHKNNKTWKNYRKNQYRGR